eukprot:5317425-Amphidinium_carterae.1
MESQAHLGSVDPRCQCTLLCVTVAADVRLALATSNHQQCRAAHTLEGWRCNASCLISVWGAGGGDSVYIGNWPLFVRRQDQETGETQGVLQQAQKYSDNPRNFPMCRTAQLYSTDVTIRTKPFPAPLLEGHLWSVWRLLAEVLRPASCLGLQAFVTGFVKLTSHALDLSMEVYKLKAF